MSQHDHSVRYVLRAKKCGVTKYCTAMWKDKLHTTLSWHEENSVLAAMSPISFSTKKQAWYIWYEWKRCHPDLCLGWKPEVIEYEP